MTHGKKTLCFLAFLFTSTFILAHPSSADLGSEFGFGPVAAALAGNSVAWNFNGFAGYNNPAGLPLIDRSGFVFPDARFIISYGVVYMDPQFTPIDNVTIANKFWGNDISGNNFTNGTVDTGYKTVFGQEIGAAYRLDPEWYDFTVGLTVFFPFEQLAYLDSGETYEPEYILYRTGAQQPDVSISAGMELTPHFHVGAGLHVAYNLSSSASGTIQAIHPTTERFSSNIKPKASPYLGMLLSSDDNQSTLGLVFRFPLSEDSIFDITTGAQPIGAFPNIPVAFVANDTIVYQPLAVELGGSIVTSENSRTYAQVDYENWSHYRAPYLQVANPCAGVGCGIAIQPGPTLDVHYRDIFIPRLAEEISFGTTKLRLGYSYRPGIIKDPPSGIGNYLDPSKHLFNAGVGMQFNRFFGYKKPWNLDISLDYQQLVTQHVTKTPGDESGDTTSRKIGAPGYDAGGHVVGGQIALSVGI